MVGGRSVLSHFLNFLSNTSSPCCFPAASASASICSMSGGGGGGRIPSAYLAQTRLGGATDSRCYCSVSVSSSQPDDSKTVKKRMVSGVQPTGFIHLGNYLGTIKKWNSYQETHEAFFIVADQYAIILSDSHDPQKLSKDTRNTAAIFLACGVDTSKASIFVQSHVRAHTEMMWLLYPFISIERLTRMIQFKEKSRQAGGKMSLLLYPVLMASDILLYQTDLVPVGEDQMQHIELVRDLAEKVNCEYEGNKWKELGGRGDAIFKVPESRIQPSGGRVMSLTGGFSKMSKSAPSDQSRINLLDPKEVIVSKIKRCKTDSFPGLEFDNHDRPECHNLLTIYQLITGKTKEEVTQECHDMNWGTFKPLLTDVLIDHLHPIQDRYKEIISDSAYLDRVLVDGATKASETADATLNNMYQAMGYLRRQTESMLQ